LKTIRDWTDSISFLLGSFVLGYLAYYNSNYGIDIENRIAIICALLSLITLYGAYNSKVILNFNDDYLTYTFLIIFRRKIKLSQIDSAQIGKNTNLYRDNEGKLKSNSFYKVYLYGSFGERSIKFSANSSASSLVSSIQNRR
jgi:hypothetical protein